MKTKPSQGGKTTTKSARGAQPQTSSRARAGAGGGAARGDARPTGSEAGPEPEAIVVTRLKETHDDGVPLTPAEYQALKAFAAQRGVSMAELVKLDALRSASIAGFQAGAEAGGVTIEVQDEHGTTWCLCDLPAQTYGKLKRATAALGIDVATFIKEAVYEKFGREKLDSFSYVEKEAVAASAGGGKQS